MELQLGSKVKDRITGFTGVVTGHCEYITGCNQSLVQPPVKADGEFVNAGWFDDDRLEVLEANSISLKITSDGPDVPAPIK